MKKNILAIIVCISAITSFGCENHSIYQTEQTKELESHNDQFLPKIIQVADNVYVASGYDASNVSMIIGDDGVVLIDAGKVPALTKKIAQDLKEICDKPIKGVIFTHAHGDHTQGIVSFTLADDVKVWAAENFGYENKFPQDAGFENPRSHKQSGLELPPEKRINNGVAPAVYPGGKYVKGRKIGNLYKPFSKDILTNLVSNPIETINIAGVELELTRADGETADHLIVYYPKNKVVFTGDMIYKSFPNLYAIRGGVYRDVKEWIKSLEIIKSKNANAMVMGHTRPVVGNADVNEVISTYLEGVKYVFDKSIEGMNKGLTADELVEYVKLPKKYEEYPYLREYYGRVDWSVRNIFNGYLGWFDGNATNLKKLSPTAEATEFIALVGGKENLYNITLKAYEDGKYQWSLQLVDRLLALDKDNQQYRNLKAKSLEKLAQQTITATMRNYYYTEAQELISQ